jgi:hypothetical protein
MLGTQVQLPKVSIIEPSKQMKAASYRRRQPATRIERR